MWLVNFLHNLDIYLICTSKFKKKIVADICHKCDWLSFFSSHLLMLTDMLHFFLHSNPALENDAWNWSHSLFIGQDGSQVLNAPVRLGTANSESCASKGSCLIYKTASASLADTGAGRPSSLADIHDHPWGNLTQLVYGLQLAVRLKNNLVLMLSACRAVTVFYMTMSQSWLRGQNMTLALTDNN